MKFESYPLRFGFFRYEAGLLKCIHLEFNETQDANEACQGNNFQPLA